MDVTRGFEQKDGHRVSRRSSRRKFSRTSDRTHVANSNSGRPKRGGIRL